MFELTLLPIPPLLAALVAGAVYSRVFRNDHVPGVNGLSMLMLSIGFASLVQAGGLLLADPSHRLLAMKIAGALLVFAPVAWFAFCISYSRRQLKLPLALLNIVSVIPLVSILLGATNPMHHLVWLEQPFPLSPGPWFTFQEYYGYILIIAGCAILAFMLSLAQSNWRPIVTVLCAPAMACIGNITSLSGEAWGQALELTSLGFALGAWALYRGILKNGLLDTIPVVRDRVVNQLSDPVVVTSHRGIIIDANQAALTMFGMPREEVIDRTIAQFMSNWPPASLTERGAAHDEITIGGQIYDVAFSRLDPTQNWSDVVLVFRDVTVRREDERRLRKLQKELERLAHTDALTGLYNRRIFMQRLEEEVERVRRHGTTLSVLLFDLDFFKKVNDTYGHDAGDIVLAAVARVATQVKRMSDVAARLGGEEFALLLPETDQQGAVQLAQRLRTAIERHQYLSPAGVPLHVTASIGVATATHEAREIEKLLSLADRQLYRAKNNGRNRVCSTML
ncbi:MAG: sensor domain-containing diguanylate cyclase [Pseudomonadales bacterium]|nr:sensor domain-containing diguanylate cyclase [Pseudomonadales bacterium]